MTTPMVNNDGRTGATYWGHMATQRHVGTLPDYSLILIS